jgi:hypothetical protein
MVICAECEKKLGMFEGYRHPALGERFLVCGACFDKVTGDMERWSRFCLSPTFTNDSSIKEIQEAWNTSISSEPLLQQWFVNLWMKIRLQDLQHIQKRSSMFHLLFWESR